MCGGKVKGVIPGELELILEYFRLNKNTRVRRMAFRFEINPAFSKYDRFLLFSNSITIILNKKIQLCPIAFINTTLLI
jgi:hypothetical protein